MSHLTWIAWDRPLGDDNYTSRALRVDLQECRHDCIILCMLRPCTLTGTLRPRLSLSLSFILVTISSSHNFSFRVYVRVATGVLAATRSTGVEPAGATSGIAPSPRLARAEESDFVVSLFRIERCKSACFSYLSVILRSDCIEGIKPIIDNINL